MNSFTLAALQQEGERLGAALPGGSIIWLQGPLGAGKTTLARAIAHGRGITGDATSPTFGLVHHYEGPRGALYHIDCYRLRTPDQAADLDWESLVSGDMLLIEWPERAGAWAPPASMHITLAHDGDDTRGVAIT